MTYKTIIGINAFHGDSSACLIEDNKLIFASEEERLNRIKHWAGFPMQSIELCISKQHKKNKNITLAFNFNLYSNLFEKFSYLFLNPSRIIKIKRSKKRLNTIQKYVFELQNKYPNINFNCKFVEHHKSHINSSYYLSDFIDSGFISIDGFGDFISSQWGYVKSGKFITKGKTPFPHSLGIFYQSITQFLGFNNYGDEYKVMGLAPYGRDLYKEVFDKIIKYKYPASYELNLKYFRHQDTNFKYAWENKEPKIEKLYSTEIFNLFGDARKSDEAISQKHKDIACSLQLKFEEIVYEMLKDVKKITNMSKICISGGCAMNSVMNGKIHSSEKFEVFVPPAAGDAGGAIGSALECIDIIKRSKSNTNFNNPYLGIKYNISDIEKILIKSLNKYNNIFYEKFDFNYIIEEISKEISNGKVIGWFQGSYEWGPRALGNRSILMDPRNKNAKQILNEKIKRRETFRPFAPSILEDHADDWFNKPVYSPYMSYVIDFKENKKELIPAVCHVDGTGRLQTVSKELNNKYYQLIQCFYNLTGVPILLNTSFNENEPIVNHPIEAINCFLRTKMDILVIENYIICRK